MKSNGMRRIAVVAGASAVIAATALGTGLATANAEAPGNETAPHGQHIALGKQARPAKGGNLAYKGGQVSVNPKVYIIYWGNQWGSAGTNGLPTSDPSAEAPLQKSFFSGLNGTGDTWSTSTTQYCEGVATGTTQCGTSGTHPAHPASNIVAGTWVDNSAAAPNGATQSQIAAEAAAAAAHFNDYSNGVQYIIDFPTGVEPSGFAAAGGTYCAYHDSTVASGGTIAYTNMPYMTDAGASCGANFVPPSNGVNGNTEGVTIVGGHEYGETVTDQWPSTQIAWTDGSGAENGDKCAWISSGQGASTIISNSGGSFAVQSLWSNNFNSNAGGCVSFYQDATNQH